MRLDKTPKRVGIGKEKVLRTETWSYPMLKVKGNKEEQAKAIEKEQPVRRKSRKKQ